MKPELKKLLSPSIYNNTYRLGNVTEIRIRIGRSLVVLSRTRRVKCDYICSKSDIEYVLAVASGHSLYAVEESIRLGYIACEGGIRVGLVGEAVTNNGVLVTLKNISSVVIRVPTESGHISSTILPILNNFTSTLIVSPPYGGKTTLLREMVKRISNHDQDILVIDERNELSATVNGIATLDLGDNTDVMMGVDKVSCYESAVRTMSPRIIATDEIFGNREIDCIIDAKRCGISVLATVHGSSIDSVISDKNYARLIPIMDNYIELSILPKAGTVSEVRCNCLC